MFQKISAAVYCLIISLVVAACSSVEIQPDETDKFAAGNYQYYKWRSAAVPLDAKDASSRKAIDPAVREGVNASLQAKGYILDPERAQFSVGYTYGFGIREGVPSDDASNITFYPPGTINRKIDQASVDNAIALGGVKETSELQLQLRDIASQSIVWEAVMTEIIADANRADTAHIDKSLQKAIPRSLRSLPDAL